MVNLHEINESAFEYYARLRRIRQHVEQFYCEPLSLQKAASIAGMERKYFSTFFHRKVGVCFRHWLMWVRIRKAIRLIESEDSSITEVALAHGFTDLRTFERAFKRCTGLTPFQFRKRSRPS